MRWIHHMPFGAVPLSDGGGTRFSLWAPSAKRVELLLDSINGVGGRKLTMSHEDDGWFASVVGDAPPGTRYRYSIDGGMAVPDPASRFQPDDVHGASEVIAPLTFEWPDDGWCGRPWKEAVLYELHVGTFTHGGRFDGVTEKLGYLEALGITAIELMPIADAPGSRNWGYDGAYPFAPEAGYGRPEQLKELVSAAHRRGLMVFLDVVYNHFGPEGNYLHFSAPQFFTERHHTPWGAAINFDGPDSRTVRDFFIHNALYWLQEYRMDGLRLDAVHTIHDDSEPDILTELAETVRQTIGSNREVHLVLENDANEARYLSRDNNRPRHYTAQWNDDFHHALHVLLTDERSGYYADYVNDPLRALGRALAEGFAFQGEISAHRGGVSRGEPSVMLPPTAFVNFLQNHDQVGNRAFGERIDELVPAERGRIALAIFLLAPSPPLLFMGEEWGARARFPFFCEFGPDLADNIREGRWREFAHFPEFRTPDARRSIPDPLAKSTFEAAVLDWDERDRSPHRERSQLIQELLDLRKREIVPKLARMSGHAGSYRILEPFGLTVSWRMGQRVSLHLLANLSDSELGGIPVMPGRLLFAEGRDTKPTLSEGRLPPWSAAWYLEEVGDGEER